VSRPFAAISVARGEEPVVRLLSSELTLAGTQGIGPAGPKERELWTRSEEVLAEVEAGAAPLSDTARRFFAQWAAASGVIAGCLPDAQRAFLAFARAVQDPAAAPPCATRAKAQDRES